MPWGWVFLRFVDMRPERAEEVIRMVTPILQKVLPISKHLHVDFLVNTHKHKDQQIEEFDLNSETPPTLHSRRVHAFATFVEQAFRGTVEKLKFGCFNEKKRRRGK